MMWITGAAFLLVGAGLMWLGGRILNDEWQNSRRPAATSDSDSTSTGVTANATNAVVSSGQQGGITAGVVNIVSEKPIPNTNATHADLEEKYPYGFIVFSYDGEQRTYKPTRGTGVEWAADWDETRFEVNAAQERGKATLPRNIVISVNGRAVLDLANNAIKVGFPFKTGVEVPVTVFGTALSNVYPFVAVLNANPRKRVFLLGFRDARSGEQGFNPAAGQPGTEDSFGGPSREPINDTAKHSRNESKAAEEPDRSHANFVESGSEAIIEPNGTLSRVIFRAINNGKNNAKNVTFLVMVLSQFPKAPGASLPRPKPHTWKPAEEIRPGMAYNSPIEMSPGMQIATVVPFFVVAQVAYQDGESSKWYQHTWYRKWGDKTTVRQNILLNIDDSQREEIRRRIRSQSIETLYDDNR